jgi:hypothetical protein
MNVGGDMMISLPKESPKQYTNFFADENKIQTEMENIKKQPYKLTDLLYAIEKGNQERVIAHIRSSTPLNTQTVIHRDFLESFNALEYAAKCRQYEIFKDILKNSPHITQKLLQMAEKDPKLETILKNFK